MDKYDRQNSKSEYRNSKQILMTKDRNSKQYDLEDRTLEFARRVRKFVKLLPKTLANIKDGVNSITKEHVVFWIF